MPVSKLRPSKIFRAPLEALQFIRETLEPVRDHPIDSIRRIARFVARLASDLELDPLSAAANDLVQAQEDEVPRLLDLLLKALQLEVSHTPDEIQRILIVESDPTTATILQASLASERRDISLATSAAAARHLLDDLPFAMIVLDQSLSDADGRDLLLDLRVEPQTRTTPVLMLSDRSTPQSTIECMTLGADHHFDKPPDPHLLAAAVSTELRNAHERGREALRDPVTGLPNRASFRDEFERARLLSQRSGQPLTLAMIEFCQVDGWDRRFERSVIDRWLRHGASVVVATLRRSVLIARWADGQLVALFQNARVDGAHIALQKTKEQLLSSPIPSSHGRSTTLDLRAGVAEVAGDQKAGDAVAEAERALLEAIRTKAGTTDSTREKRVQGNRVLVVQDDPIAAAIITHWLQRDGFHVCHYTDGAEALAASADLDARLVILDVKLPGMDGFELVGHLRRRSMYARVPIAVLSSTDREEDIVRALALGADDYIVKPFSTAEFVARIRRLVGANLRDSDHDTLAAPTAS